ncbi:glycosyltransferase [Phycisphaerales bacterium AB-hyl4]|uniref:Glycosyltransferase n=1 Tax=Natronomicrosphaera hydrolytica TaxID=3242702 RepID=A0ABV4U3M5_9BACT
MNYDILIATRNRAAALRMSIPMMLTQSRRPSRLIVADCSDDHAEIAATVQELALQHGVPAVVLNPPAGKARQLNHGLEHVQSPVVMVPDDDSLWFPDTAEQIMQVYERDDADIIGAVCAAESPDLPQDQADRSRQQQQQQKQKQAQSYRMTWTDQARQMLAHPRQRFERRYCPDPFLLHGRACWQGKPVPTWLYEMDAVLVEWMTGFRMSFRTDLIRSVGFDERLAAPSLTWVMDDVDASFNILRDRLIVGARRAKVHHYRWPSRRGSGMAMGVTQVLMAAYVICKHTTPDAPVRRQLAGYARMKLMKYLAAAHTPFGRDRVRGAWRASRCIPDLLKAEPEHLATRYHEAVARCLNVSLEATPQPPDTALNHR